MSPFVRSLILALVAATATSVVASCGSEPPTITPPPPGVVDPSLPGTWKGTVDGDESSNSYGRANMTMVFRADSTFTAETDNPLYCALNQTSWRVTGTQFSARGVDCHGVVVTFAATVPTTVARLSGTWTATSGRKGTFRLSKER